MKKWTMPEYYFGDTYEDYYILLSQHRDSNLIDTSNFKVAQKMLSDKEGNLMDGVEVVRANHYLVGWVETILIHQDYPDAIKIAEEIEESLSDYPVLDDEDYSKAQDEQAQAYWDNMPMGDRYEMVVENNKHSYNDKVSIFAIRRNHYPNELCEELISD